MFAVTFVNMTAFLFREGVLRHGNFVSRQNIKERDTHVPWKSCIIQPFRRRPKWNTSCAFVVLLTYNGRRVRMSVKPTRPWVVLFLILAFRRVLARCALDPHFCRARTGASSQQTSTRLSKQHYVMKVWTQRKTARV